MEFHGTEKKYHNLVISFSVKHQEPDTSDAGVGDISKARLQELLPWVGVVFNENQKVFGRPGTRVISTFLSEKFIQAAGGVQ